MPELISVLPQRKSRLGMGILFLVQNLGVLLGFALLLGIALSEESGTEWFEQMGVTGGEHGAAEKGAPHG